MGLSEVGKRKMLACGMSVMGLGFLSFLIPGEYLFPIAGGIVGYTCYAVFSLLAFGDEAPSDKIILGVTMLTAAAGIAIAGGMGVVGAIIFEASAMAILMSSGIWAAGVDGMLTHYQPQEIGGRPTKPRKD